MSEAGASPVPPVDISIRYASCLTAFRENLALLSHSKSAFVSSSASRPEETLSGRTLREYGRLRIWGEETRAALPTASRGSLDDTLRKDEEMKITVADILAKVEDQINSVNRKLQSIQGGDDVQEDPSQSSESDEDTESSSDEDSGRDGGTMTSEAQRTLRVYRNIKEDIDMLCQVSLLITRPGYKRRSIHSTGQTKWDARVAYFADFDTRYIEDKVLNWKRQQVGGDEEHAVTPEVTQSRISSDEFPGQVKTLIQRLARANTKRREQLVHWSKHPDQEPTVFRDDNSPGEENPIKAMQLMHKPSKAQSDRQSQGNKTTTTKRTFSTVVLSDMLGPRTVAGPTRTIYAESTAGNRRSNRVPDVPKLALDNETFQCPYCQLVLNSGQMQNRQEWKRHVFRDLRPYICTSMECQNPNKQYPTRHDWMYHEMQMHRRRWVCVEHNSSFARRESFIEHVQASHPTAVTTRQLPVLVEMSERPIDSSEIVSCPLCPEERRLISLQSHLAEHLESIALFVLPSDSVEKSEDNISFKGVAGGTLSLRTEDSSKPGHFSDSNDEQTAEQSLMACDHCQYQWLTVEPDVQCAECSSTEIRVLETLQIHDSEIQDRTLRLDESVRSTEQEDPDTRKNSSSVTHPRVEELTEESLHERGNTISAFASARIAPVVAHPRKERLEEELSSEDSSSSANSIATETPRSPDQIRNTPDRTASIKDCVALVQELLDQYPDDGGLFPITGDYPQEVYRFSGTLGTLFLMTKATCPEVKWELGSETTMEGLRELAQYGYGVGTTIGELRFKFLYIDGNGDFIDG